MTALSPVVILATFALLVAFPMLVDTLHAARTLARLVFHHWAGHRR